MTAHLHTKHLHRKKHVPKTYEVTLEHEPTEDDVNAFKEGVYIEGGYLTKPAELILKGGCDAVITIKEGRYHQIKQMFGARKNKVTELKRVTFGGLKLPNDLAEGDIRELSCEEKKRCFYAKR